MEDGGDNTCYHSDNWRKPKMTNECADRSHRKWINTKKIVELQYNAKIQFIEKARIKFRELGVRLNVIKLKE